MYQTPLHPALFLAEVRLIAEEATRPMFHPVSGEMSNTAKMPLYRHSCSKSGQCHTRLSLLCARQLWRSVQNLVGAHPA